MECPKCQARMEQVRFEDVEVDRCVRCGGLWFDRLEHEELKRRPGSEEIDTGPTWQASMHDSQEKVYCPVDGTLMVPMVDPGKPPVRMESCPVCQGAFFDAGEFTDWKPNSIRALLGRWRRARST